MKSKKLKNNVLVAFTSLFIITSCKYEDGPSISLRSAEKRIDGTYDVVKYTIDGFDSTAALKSKPCYGLITFRTYKIYGNRNNLSCGFNDTYNLTNGNKSIKFSISSNFPEMPPLGPIDASTWDIKELRNDEMTFETVYNGKICVLKLTE